MSDIRIACAICFRSFQALSAALPHGADDLRVLINGEALEDELGRLRVWTGNLGALQQGHSSLDYRLRDSPLLQSNVLKLLKELHTNLSEALNVISGRRPPYEKVSSLEDDDSDSFYSEDEDDDSTEDGPPKTELEQRFHEIIDIINHLYKLSVRIRSPTLRSRSSKAATFRPVIDGVDLFEQYAAYDLQYVHEVLQRLRYHHSKIRPEDDDYLVQRLSKAITLRRRQFRYWQRHRDKLGASSTIDQEAIRPVSDDKVLKQEQPVVEHGAENGLITTLRDNTPSERVPQTLLSGTEATQHHQSLDEVVDSQSVTSYATTTRDLSGRGIELPPPPKVADGEKEFECPYCYIICPARYGTNRGWRTHLLQDLQPYICTYEDCANGNQLFRSRREWLEHEAMHRRLFRCPEHPEAVFRSRAGLSGHLQDNRAHSISHDQLASVIQVGETSSMDLRPSCPICLADADMDGGLPNHIANHLERLAAFALPKNVENAEDDSEGANSVVSRGLSRTLSSEFLVSDWTGQFDGFSGQNVEDALLPALRLKFTEHDEKPSQIQNVLSADSLSNLPDSTGNRLGVLLQRGQTGQAPGLLARAIKERDASDSTEHVMAGPSGPATHQSPKVTPIALAQLSSLERHYAEGRFSRLVKPVRPFNDTLKRQVYLFSGDITRLKVDAIVNSVNRPARADASWIGTLDAAVHRAAGPALERECSNYADLRRGEVFMSNGYELPCSKVLHALFPIYNGPDDSKILTELSSCYRRSLEIAASAGLKSIAFPTVWVGGGSFSLRTATRVAIEEVQRFLDADKGGSLEAIVFCVYSNTDEWVYEELLPAYFPPSGLSDKDHPQHPEMLRDDTSFARELDRLSLRMNEAGRYLWYFQNNIQGFDERILGNVTKVSASLRVLQKSFESGESFGKGPVGRTIDDLDLLCSVLDNICGEASEINERVKYAGTGNSSYSSVWTDYDNVKLSKGLGLCELLELCLDLVQHLEVDIPGLYTLTGVAPPDMSITRDKLARHRPRLPNDLKEVRYSKSDELPLARQYTSQARAELDRDVLDVSRVPSVRDLYARGELNSQPTKFGPIRSANERVCLVEYDLTKLLVDVIVNSTDPNFSEDGALTLAILKAGGPKMREEYGTLGPGEPGEVKLSSGHLLPCKNVIHVVPADTMAYIPPLRSCYRSALALAVRIGARHIAFPTIGNGSLLYPQNHSASVAMEEVRRFLDEDPESSLEKIIFCVYEESDRSTYEDLLPTYFPPDGTNAGSGLSKGDIGKGDHGTSPIPIPGRPNPIRSVSEEDNEESPRLDQSKGADGHHKEAGRTPTGATEFHALNPRGKPEEVGIDAFVEYLDLATGTWTKSSPNTDPERTGIDHPFVEYLDLAAEQEKIEAKSPPQKARWTKIDRRLVNPEALREAKLEFEERLDCVIVLKVLWRHEIQQLANRTKEIREQRSKVSPRGTTIRDPASVEALEESSERPELADTAAQDRE